MESRIETEIRRKDRPLNKAVKEAGLWSYWEPKSTAKL